MRKYPALPFVTRVCVKDYHVPDSDLVIEEGTQIFVPIKAIHYDADYYENPERFDPDRFTEQRIKERNSFSHLPFGEGPRMCIGKYQTFNGISNATHIITNNSFWYSNKEHSLRQFSL